jgi:hypothetical protein
VNALAERVTRLLDDPRSAAAWKPARSTRPRASPGNAAEKKRWRSSSRSCDRPVA